VQLLVTDVLVQKTAGTHKLLVTGTVTVAVTVPVVLVIVLGLMEIEAFVPTPTEQSVFEPAVMPSEALAPGTMHARDASKAALLAACKIMLYRPNSNVANRNSNKTGTVKANSTTAAPLRSAARLRFVKLLCNPFTAISVAC
jgi:hypothetical protein